MEKRNDFLFFPFVGSCFREKNLVWFWPIRVMCMKMIRLRISNRNFNLRKEIGNGL
jgi:hypothetical protein